MKSLVDIFGQALQGLAQRCGPAPGSALGGADSTAAVFTPAADTVPAAAGAGEFELHFFGRRKEIENFPVGKGVCIEVDGKRIAVFNTTGQYYGIDDACPHANGSFSEGALNGSTVTCPLHGATADVRIGSCTPPAREDVETYDVSCDGQSLFIAV